MDNAVKLVFDLLAFTSVMVLIVLGLGVIASMMGMYIAVCKVDAGKTRYAVVKKSSMVDPKEC